MSGVDAEFLALPLSALADAALTRARELGASYAALRVVSLHGHHLSLQDLEVESSATSVDVGLAVRVVHDGCWGFAAGLALTTDEAPRLAERAVAVAVASRPVSTERVELADEPVYAGVTWSSPYELDPFAVADGEKVATLVDLSERLAAGDGVSATHASVQSARESVFYADSFGTSTTQTRVRIHPVLSAVAVDRAQGGFESMRTLAPPAAAGWEYVLAPSTGLEDEVAQLPELLREKVKAPSVRPGVYDLVVDGSNLWLTIHESVGHATELDRVLGYEAAYAGTSFATTDKLGTFAYGSPAMHVTGDRDTDWGLASVGWDDEGVAAQHWDIVRDGVLVGYQTDRAMAALRGLGRSNGASYADSARHVPLQRMVNVSLQPDPDGGGLDALLSRVEDGIYVVGDNSWSIDMQRYNFQFTGQRFYRIEGGRLAGQVRDVAYQATTTDFWRSMEAVGGPATFYRGGALNCGKAQPGQVSAASHGTPAGLFRGVRILNTVAEAGH
ncbi:TldD/PmbA family protein [Lapillicoccus jejuensis]|uniref:TldD protein n=1 Tax=Lapillicoccus jejuensis TaxID=402171 RepID=A0A542E2A0_9MICO|nr:TldD/PmbA family protein [Lapillicoccus jejuensis]TQJ09472.1 TldD protein [Lapillicoccus jejuensis]